MTYTIGKSGNTVPLIKGKLMPGGENPAGERIDVNNIYIEKGGNPVIPVMGEYHFVRDRRDNFYTELCKMKAGGISVVSTYIFWIYHEETEGEFDFSGDLDIAFFVKEAKRAGLDVILRPGPWVHGECRNGGLPDWIVSGDYVPRTNDEKYMKKVRIFFEKIYHEVKGLFYKDGGNIIGMQIENELADGKEHILSLKRMAQDIGFDVPIWTATGWGGRYGATLPEDEVLPIFGGYPEAPWEDSTEKLPPSVQYVFSKERNDGLIGVDLLKMPGLESKKIDYTHYPFLTCELGGGNQVTHHRRPIITGLDIYSLSLCKLGSGNNLIGYYMYKGGTNKVGKKSYFNESKQTGYPNDYTALSYDFQAPISEYGEIREKYRLLNLLHLFAADFGEILAPMQAVMPEKEVTADNFSDMRYCVRCEKDAKSGFLFVNRYQRKYELSDINDAEFVIGNTRFPKMDVKNGMAFILPFGINLSGQKLSYSTCQLVCKCENAYFFAEIPGIKPEYAFDGGKKIYPEKDKITLDTVGSAVIITLPFESAKRLRRLDGKIYIGNGCDIFMRNGKIENAENKSFSYLEWTGKNFESHSETVKTDPAELLLTDCSAPFEPSEKYELSIGGKRKLSWKKLEATSSDGFVEINFDCDCEQLYANGEMIADNFYFGKPWRIPAKLLYGKECYLVFSERKNDFYKEF